MTQHDPAYCDKYRQPGHVCNQPHAAADPMGAVRPEEPHFPDCPTEAHTHEPWTDADTAELAAAMDDARWREGTRHALARIGAGIITSTAPSTSANSPSTLRQLAEAGRAERAIDNLTDDSPRAYALVAVLVADHRAHRAY